jgi:phage-related protein
VEEESQEESEYDSEDETEDNFVISPSAKLLKEELENENISPPEFKGTHVKSTEKPRVLCPADFTTQRVEYLAMFMMSKQRSLVDDVLRGPPPACSVEEESQEESEYDSEDETEDNFVISPSAKLLKEELENENISPPEFKGTHVKSTEKPRVLCPADFTTQRVEYLAMFMMSKQRSLVDDVLRGPPPACSVEEESQEESECDGEGGESDSEGGLDTVIDSDKEEGMGMDHQLALLL